MKRKHNLKLDTTKRPKIRPPPKKKNSLAVTVKTALSAQRSPMAGRCHNIASTARNKTLDSVSSFRDNHAIVGPAVRLSVGYITRCAPLGAGVVDGFVLTDLDSRCYSFKWRLRKPYSTSTQHPQARRPESSSSTCCCVSSRCTSFQLGERSSV